MFVFLFFVFLQVVEYVRNHHDDVNVSTAWQKVVVFWYTTHHSCFSSSLSVCSGQRIVAIHSTHGAKRSHESRGRR